MIGRSTKFMNIAFTSINSLSVWAITSYHSVGELPVCGHGSYQPLGAPQALQNLGKDPKTCVCESDIFISNVRKR